LIDPFNRTIDYLRVSVTDRCNFRCVYCMPEEGFPCTPKDEHLTTDEFVRLIGIAVQKGIRKVRLTGGEPLLRKDIVELVRAISFLGVDDLSLTTNGFMLAEKAPDLKMAGLQRVNVSLDTLQPVKFQEIARRGCIEQVLEGIKTAQAVGLQPMKINCVALKGVNDHEAAEFARWTLQEDVHVRFIEVMPMRWNLDETPETQFDHGLQLKQAAGNMLSDLQMRRMFVSSAELQDRITTELGPLHEAEIRTNGPARTYRLEGAKGTIGFISQISHDFCERCNRLRLTHDGFLRPCLMSDGELDFRTPLRSGASDEDLAALLDHVVAHKPERHYLAEGQKVTGRGMSQIGG
jgi:cyclic pyranopterin phosphate synthase